MAAGSASEVVGMHGRWGGVRGRWDRADAVGAAAVLVGFGLVWLATRAGPGVTNDSLAYLSTAQHIAHHGHLTAFDDQRLSIFPPGYSALVALLLRLGVHTQQTVRCIGLATTVIAVGATRRLGREAGLGRMAAAVASLFVALNTGLVVVYSMAWSEPVFVAATLVGLVALTRLHRIDHWHLPTVAVLVLSVGVAGLTRYTGLVLVGVTGGVLVVGRWPKGRVRYLLAGGAVAAASAWGVVAVVLINLMGGQALMGARGGHTYSFGAVVTQVVSTLGGYLLGVHAGVGADQLVGSLVLVLFLVGLGIGALRLWRQPRATWASPALPATAFVVAYGAFLGLSEMTTMLNPVDSRLMAPMFAPLVVLGALMVAPNRAWIADLRAAWAAPRPRRVPTIVGHPAFGAIAVVILV
ncbi:MAG TPA: hypothetical protein VGM93_06890, partial [Acidimicrobiales bacterium]